MKIEKLLFGDDETQGIVSIYADRQGNVHIWQRNQETGELSYHRKEIYHWAIVTDPDLTEGILKVRELEGDHPLRYLVGSKSDRQLQKQIVGNHNRKHHAGIQSLFDLKKINAVYSLSAIEQFLVKSGITHFKGLEWVKVHRLCFDLETSSLNPAEGEILAIAVRDNRGYEQVIHSDKEAEIISEFVSRVQELDPDVIEGFNIFGFDFPFLDFRAKQHKIPLAIGRIYQTKNGETIRSTLAESGTRSLKVGGDTEQYRNYTLIGREIIDTYHAVKRWNAITRELPNHRLKDVAIHFGIAQADREYIAGDRIAEVWKHDKDRVIRYALGDVRETMQIADMLMGSAFELAKIVPTSFERIATSGTATAIDLLMVRGYLNQNHALPLPKQKTDRYEGGHTEICLSGVIENVVKADVESMYPNIMLTHFLAPESDHLGLFLPMLRSLTETRLDLKGKLKTLDRDSRDYHAVDARQGALKILINSAYGYLGTGFTTFNDPDQAAKVTRIGREIILQMKSIVESFGGTPIEIDTDGIFIGLDEDSDPEYFVGQINERLARPEVKIGFDGHWQAGYFVGMKNYALIDQPGKLTIKGASLKSSNLETAFRDYISEGLVDLLSGDLKALKKRFRNLFTGLEDRTIPTEDIAATKRLAKNPDEYKGKQPQVEAAKNAGLELKQGDFVTHYRAITGEWKVLDTDRDYDSQFYIKKLIETNRRVFGSAFTEADFKALFGESEGISIDAIKPIQSERNTADLAWVELMYGTTLVGQRKRKRVIRKWFRLDDQESIDEFIRKHKNTDLHRSQLVVYSPAQPKKGDHRKCKRLGKFLIEIDGDKNDPMKAVQCTIEMLRIIDEKLGVTPEIRFSGNKSFYLSIQLDAGPGYNLHEKHKRFAEALRDLLPEQYQSMIDMDHFAF